MKRVAEKTTKITKNVLEHTNTLAQPVTIQKRDFATVSGGYLEKSSVNHTQNHPQVLQKDSAGNIITENQRAGLSHAALLNPQHEAKLPKVVTKYSIGKDMENKKEQYCYHFDGNYSTTDLSKYKESPILTQYLNDPQRLSINNAGFALARGLAHIKEMTRIVAESDKAFAALEETLKNYNG